MKDVKKDFLFVFYLISGIIVGSLLTAVCENVSWLSWVSYGITVGFGIDSPAILDLSVLKLALGFSFSLTVAHIITIAAAMAIYGRFKK